MGSVGGMLSGLAWGREIAGTIEMTNCPSTSAS